MKINERFLRGGMLYLIALAGAVFGSRPAMAQQSADLILHNGKILTVDANFATAQAVAVTGNKISAVGTDADVLKTAGQNTVKIDLKGRTVVPGLIDTHLHITGPGSYMDPLPADKRRDFSVDWKGVSNKDDVLNQIRGIMTKYHPPKGEWIAFANQLSFSGVCGGNKTTAQQQPT